MAVREYIDAGGLYLVVYDNNSYAGPVASFLGCSPYQFAIRSSRVGFAGPRVIRETTGVGHPTRLPFGQKCPETRAHPGHLGSSGIPAESAQGPADHGQPEPLLPLAA